MSHPRRRERRAQTRRRANKQAAKSFAWRWREWRRWEGCQERLRLAGGARLEREESAARGEEVVPF